MSPTAAGLSVSCSKDFSVSSISCDFTVSECQAARQQIQLGLEVKVTTGVQRQRLLLGDVGELPDLTLESPSLTYTVPLSSTRPNASAAFTSASE